MITWLQTRFQRGYKVLFLVLLVVVIIAFVFTIGAAPGMGSATATERQDFYGYNLNNPREVERLVQNTQISHLLSFGRTIDDSNRLESYALERLAYVGLAGELKLPEPSPEKFRDFMMTREAFMNPVTGQYDREEHAAFIDQIQANPLISEDDVARILYEDFLVQQVRSFAEGPGYVHPSEVKAQLSRQRRTWSIEVASLPLDRITVEEEPSEEALRAFYEENHLRYELPVQLDISYVVFEIEAFLAEVDPPSEAVLSETFERERARFTPPHDHTEEDHEHVEIELDDVRDEVEAFVMERQARRRATEVASDFTYTLFEQGISSNSEELHTLIESMGLERVNVEPFPQGGAPDEHQWPDRVLTQIPRLSPNRYFSDPVLANGHYVVLLLDDTIPETVPPFEEVRDTVAADFLQEERRRLIAEAGAEMHGNFVARMEAEESFEEIATDKELEVETFESFTMREAPPTLSPAVLNQLDRLQEGDVSEMISSNNHGMFVHVLSRQSPEIDVADEQFVETADQLRRFSASITAHSAIQEVIDRELQNPQVQAR